jgi:hypothetical protein
MLGNALKRVHRGFLHLWKTALMDNIRGLRR